MPRDFMGRIRDSLVIGTGGAIYTLFDTPIKNFATSISPQIGALIPEDPMDPMSAFSMTFLSSFLALTAWDLLAPRQLKKAIGAVTNT